MSGTTTRNRKPGARIASCLLAAAVASLGSASEAFAQTTDVLNLDTFCLSCPPESPPVSLARGIAAADGRPTRRNPAALDVGSVGDSVPRDLLPSDRNTERPSWSRQDKALMWSFVSLNAIDAYQTIHAPADFEESNVLLTSWAGDNPGALETLAFKGAATFGLMKLAKNIERRRTRRTALVVINLIQFAVTARNERVSGGIVF